MTPLIATSQQAYFLWVLGCGLLLLGSYFFGRWVTSFNPNNPLVRKGKKKDAKV